MAGRRTGELGARPHFLAARAPQALTFPRKNESLKRMNATHYSRLLSLQIFSLALTACLGLASARAGFVETFDNGGDDGDWHLSSNPNELLVIEPTGGNPGAYLHGTVDAAVPTWYVPMDTAPTHFLGNFAARGVGALSFDIIIYSGSEVPDRNVTLDIETTFGSGDFSKGVDAYYIGTDISHFPPGWETYSFPCDATSTTIPPGWVVTRGNGKAGTGADWQALMQDVEDLGVELGTPGYFYPDWIWDLGLDNARISKRFR